MIALDGVTKVFGDGARAVTALSEVSLRIPRGQFVAIVGPSGSGKSTLLQIVGCLDQPSSGSYRLDDTRIEDLDDLRLSRLRNQRLGFVFQSFNLIPRTTAVENVELPMAYGATAPVPGRARAMLDRVGMGHRAGHFPNELSGGEQQRVAIARALVLAPDVLIADEPTGNLDLATGEQILAILADLHRGGLTIVLVTHDAAIAGRAQRIVTLRDGRIAGDSAAVAAPGRA